MIVIGLPITSLSWYPKMRAGPAFHGLAEPLERLADDGVIRRCHYGSQPRELNGIVHCLVTSPGVSCSLIPAIVGVHHSFPVWNSSHPAKSSSIEAAIRDRPSSTRPSAEMRLRLAIEA